MADKSSSSGGISMSGALFLLFLGLKLGGVIDWSWWWVTSPLWISVGLLFIVLMLVEIFKGK